jgi:hypothetical protein
VNAAKNILARGLRFDPFASALEATVPEPAHVDAVIRKVDADELTSRRTSRADKLTQPRYVQFI